LLSVIFSIFSHSFLACAQFFPFCTFLSQFSSVSSLGSSQALRPMRTIACCGGGFLAGSPLFSLQSISQPPFFRASAQRRSHVVRYRSCRSSKLSVFAGTLSGTPVPRELHNFFPFFAGASQPWFSRPAVEGLAVAEFLSNEDYAAHFFFCLSLRLWRRRRSRGCGNQLCSFNPSLQ